MECRTPEQESELAMNFYRRILGEPPVYTAPQIKPTQFPLPRQ